MFVRPLGEERSGVRIVKPAECIVKTIRICDMVAACAAGVNIRGRYEARERGTGLSGRNQSDLRPLHPVPQNLCAERRRHGIGRARIDGERCARRIMAVLHARGARHGIRRRERGIDAHLHLWEFRRNHLARDGAGAQDGHDPVLRTVHNRGLDAPAACAAVKDARNAPRKIVRDHRRRRRTGTPRGIRGRRGDGDARRTNEGARNVMVRTAHADGREPARHDVRNMRRLWQNHGDGAGRKRREEMRRGGRYGARRIRRHREVGDVQDERVIGRTPLRRVDARTSRCVQPVRPESVDRLGRKCDERTVSNHLRGMYNVDIAHRGDDLRLHGAFLLSECVAARIKRCIY